MKCLERLINSSCQCQTCEKRKTWSDECALGNSKPFIWSEAESDITVIETST